ncbi:hypothetical protein B0H16DRAFT_1734526 [Mycena metata]|uniref:Uncharacterized protein n=1 Tax=Mycena metata TaxID=1033252 RepID=A0AAD7HUU4_9AGAR|nr:hypothetical protein B0H16DRAFT_1734526 [Mycena metata]
MRPVTAFCASRFFVYAFPVSACRPDGLTYGLFHFLSVARVSAFLLASRLPCFPPTFSSFDWWLTPELYLRRPPAYDPEWRLDGFLKQAQG